MVTVSRDNLVINLVINYPHKPSLWGRHVNFKIAVLLIPLWLDVSLLNSDYSSCLGWVQIPLVLIELYWLGWPSLGRLKFSDRRDMLVSQYINYCKVNRF